MWKFQTKDRQARAIAMSKLTKRITPFQCKHALEFSFEIIELEEKGNMSVMTSVHCLLCVYRGWYFGLVSRKRKPIDNIHVFKAPFIKQHYLSHLKQHAETWEEYNELSVDGKVKHTNTMHMYIDTNKDAICFTISLSIVDVIKELFYLNDNQIFVDIDEVNDEDEEDHHMNMEWICKKAKKKDHFEVQRNEALQAWWGQRDVHDRNVEQHTFLHNN